MAVYKRSYKSYTGQLTPEWSRWMVIPRYAWQGLFRSLAGRDVEHGPD